MAQKKEDNVITVKCLKTFTNYNYNFIKFKEYTYKNPNNNFMDFIKQMIDKKFLTLK